MEDGIEVDNGADPLNPDTDGDGILDGPDGLGDEDEDGIINVLDPREAPQDELPEEPDVLIEESANLSGSGLDPNCGCSQRADRSGQLPALLLALLALGGLRRLRRRQ